MSNDLANRNVTNRVTAIARCFGDEPKKVTALGCIGGSRIEIAGSRADKSIALQNGYVFEFDAALFSQLEDAYKAGRKDDLLTLWNKATSLQLI